MRMQFKAPFGPTKLNYPLFDDSQVDSFDTLILDSTFNGAWSSTNDVARTQYIKDQFVADLQLAAGGYSHHNKFAHVYINGLYWGMYGIHERTDESFAAAYLGGDKEDYDVVKDPARGVDVVNGSSSDYRAMFEVASAGIASDEQYELLQTYLDVPGFIDYVLVNFYAANEDWGQNNFYASRNRVDSNGRWRYHSWDAEMSFRDVHENLTNKNDPNGPTELHQ